MRCLVLALVLVATVSSSSHAQQSKYFELPKGDYPHDVTVGPNGGVVRWSEARERARLDPETGKVDRIPLGKNSAPHGVIVRPDDAPWFTDGGQNGIVRVDPATKDVKVWRFRPSACPTPTSTPRPSTAMVASGSPVRTASTAVSTPRLTQCNGSFTRLPSSAQVRSGCQLCPAVEHCSELAADFHDLARHTYATAASVSSPWAIAAPATIRLTCRPAHVRLTANAPLG